MRQYYYEGIGIRVSSDFVVTKMTDANLESAWESASMLIAKGVLKVSGRSQQSCLVLAEKYR